MRREEMVREKWVESEPRALNGNFIGNTRYNLLQPRKVNQAIEVELMEFKREIEEKFSKSLVNREYFFPWKPKVKQDDEIEVLDLSENIEIHELTHKQSDDYIAASPLNYIFKSH